MARLKNLWLVYFASKALEEKCQIKNVLEPAAILGRQGHTFTKYFVSDKSWKILQST